jgi:hypothetical protein
MIHRLVRLVLQMISAHQALARSRWGKNMHRLVMALALTLLATGSALAVSVFEISGKCGDDGNKYCEGVSYGQTMSDCLNAHYKQLSPDCKLVMDRINKGEKVSVF